MTNMSDTVEDVLSKTKEIPEDLSVQWRQWSNTAVRFFRGRPLQAMGTGILAGALLGIVLAKAFGRHASEMEDKIGKAIHFGEDKFSQVKDGLTQTARGFKSVVDAFKSR